MSSDSGSGTDGGERLAQKTTNFVSRSADFSPRLLPPPSPKRRRPGIPRHKVLSTFEVVLGSPADLFPGPEVNIYYYI